MRNAGQYLGKGDIFDLGGQQTFAGEHITGNDFGVRLRNTHDADKVIAFSPAVVMGLPAAVVNNKIPGIDAFITADGNVIETTVGDDPGVVSIETIDSANPIEFVLGFAAVNPFRIVKLALNSDKKAQFSEIIRQRIMTPFKANMGELDVNLRRYVNADQFQEDRTDIKLLDNNEVLTLSYDSVVYFRLTGKSDMQIIFDAGAINNGARTLRHRARIAQQNVIMANGRSPQR